MFSLEKLEERGEGQQPSAYQERGEGAEEKAEGIRIPRGRGLQNQINELTSSGTRNLQKGCILA